MTAPVEPATMREVVATRAEVLQVQLDPQTFSSERGGDRSGGGTLLEDLDVAGRR